MWDSLAQPLMWASRVVILDILLKRRMQMPLPEDQHVVQAFSPYAAQEPLTVDVRLGRPVRRPQHLYASGFSNLGETCPILAIVVPDQEPWYLPKWCRVAKLLGSP